MATKNTLEDLSFATMYIDFVSRRSNNPDSRARAKILLATISILDRKHPTWRKELLDELDKSNTTKDVKDMFPLPEVDDNLLFESFMRQALTNSSNNSK